MRRKSGRPWGVILLVILLLLAALGWLIYNSGLLIGLSGSQVPAFSGSSAMVLEIEASDAQFPPKVRQFSLWQTSDSKSTMDSDAA